MNMKIPLTPSELSLRKTRLQAEANDLKWRLENNGYKSGMPMDWDEWDKIPREHKDWQSRLWYIGMALTDPSMPEVS